MKSGIDRSSLDLNPCWSGRGRSLKVSGRRFHLLLFLLWVPDGAWGQSESGQWRFPGEQSERTPEAGPVLIPEPLPTLAIHGHALPFASAAIPWKQQTVQESQYPWALNSLRSLTYQKENLA